MSSFKFNHILWIKDNQLHSSFIVCITKRQKHYHYMRNVTEIYKLFYSSLSVDGSRESHMWSRVCDYRTPDQLSILISLTVNQSPPDPTTAAVRPQEEAAVFRTPPPSFLHPRLHTLHWVPFLSPRPLTNHQSVWVYDTDRKVIVYDEKCKSLSEFTVVVTRIKLKTLFSNTPFVPKECFCTNK